MSRLFLTDRGRVLMNHNEELTRWRWARKITTLPKSAAGADADLWILASSHAATREPLVVEVNGKLAAKLKPHDDQSLFTWHRISLPAKLLRAGRNDVVFKCDAPAMNAWRLAIDNTADTSNSALSHDQGATWQSDHLGVHSVLRGEYVVRLRSNTTKLSDEKPPAMVYSDPSHPRLRELRAMLPKAITSQRDPWKQVLALRTWVATRWSHDPFGDAYCPWDGPTILDWAATKRGHSGKGVVAMCVHFGVVFATYATALGHRARCCAITAGMNDPRGHFVAEVFDDKLGKWVTHDANYDTHFADAQPLSIVEVSQRAAAGDKHLAKLVQKGKGFPTGPARIMTQFRRDFSTGVSYRLVSAWRRMDFVTDPSQGATHHGSIVYHEPEWVWYAAQGVDTASELGMFPHVTADAAWFAAR